jgi:AcrR family transcriptional regulator
MEKEKKEDLRVVRTKINIKKAFIELAKNETYQRISVKDLCDIAMINRNTFYLHYQNKDDLVREMVDETISKYKVCFMPLVAQFFVDIQKKDLNSFAKNIESLLKILYEDIELYRIILTDDYLTGYFRSVEGVYEKNIMSFLNIRTNKSKLIFRYMMSGCAGILTDWMIRHTLPIDETAKIIAKLALENIYYFTEENNIY